jgi:hypothetical protein
VGEGVSVAVGFGVAVGPGFGVPVGPGRGVPVGPGLDVAAGPGFGVPVGPGSGVAVAFGVAVAVGVLVALPPNTWGWVAKNAPARIRMIRTASTAGSTHLRLPPPGVCRVVVVVMRPPAAGSMPVLRIR